MQRNEQSRNFLQRGRRVDLIPVQDKSIRDPERVDPSSQTGWSHSVDLHPKINRSPRSTSAPPSPLLGSSRQGSGNGSSADPAARATALPPVLRPRQPVRASACEAAAASPPPPPSPPAPAPQSSRSPRVPSSEAERRRRDRSGEHGLHQFLFVLLV